VRTRTLVWTLAAAPLLWAIAFWSFVVRARLALGYWPYPYHPDPKELGFPVHYVVVVAGMPLTFTAVAMAIILAVVFYRTLQLDRGRPALAAIVAICGVACLLIWARTDPGRFLAWFGD
jgi:hypothetical protein